MPGGNNSSVVREFPVDHFRYQAYIIEGEINLAGSDFYCDFFVTIIQQFYQFQHSLARQNQLLLFIILIQLGRSKAQAVAIGADYIQPIGITLKQRSEEQTSELQSLI